MSSNLPLKSAVVKHIDNSSEVLKENL